MLMFHRRWKSAPGQSLYCCGNHDANGESQSGIRRTLLQPPAQYRNVIEPPGGVDSIFTDLQTRPHSWYNS